MKSDSGRWKTHLEKKAMDDFAETALPDDDKYCDPFII
jgi:hypothetical protein